MMRQEFPDVVLRIARARHQFAVEHGVQPRVLHLSPEAYCELNEWWTGGEANQNDATGHKLDDVEHIFGMDILIVPADSQRAGRVA